MPAAPRLVAEGANTAYVTDAGLPAFGGRTIAADVAMRSASSSETKHGSRA